MSQHPSYQSRLGRAGSATAELPVTSEPAPVFTTTRRYAGRACCCIAQPAVMAVIPPGDGRLAATDLLLCGHHYRASKAVLAAAGATILDLKGHPIAGDWPAETRSGC